MGMRLYTIYGPTDSEGYSEIGNLAETFGPRVRLGYALVVVLTFTRTLQVHGESPKPRPAPKPHPDLEPHPNPHLQLHTHTLQFLRYFESIGVLIIILGFMVTLALPVLLPPTLPLAPAPTLVLALAQPYPNINPNPNPR